MFNLVSFRSISVMARVDSDVTEQGCEDNLTIDLHSCYLLVYSALLDLENSVYRREEEGVHG